MATPLKRSLASLLDIPVSDLDDPAQKKKLCTAFPGGKKTHRALMQQFGDILRLDSFGGDGLFVDLMTQKLTGHQNNVVVSDIRFQHEADMIRKLGGKLIRVTKGDDNIGDSHRSEVDLLSIRHDYLINNSGSIDDLYNQLQEILHGMSTSQQH